MAFIYLIAEANGRAVSAANGGGGDLIANKDLVWEWESFVLWDYTNDGVNNYLRNGDVIAMQAYNGQFVCAEGGGGRELVANRGGVGAWEQFTLVGLDGLPAGAQIVNSGPGAGTAVALRAYNGQWVCAEDGGASRLVANRSAVGGWERFRVGFSGGNRPRPSYSTWSSFPANP